MIDGIIFDLDGTLWDSCRVVSESWGLVLRECYGAERTPTPQDVKRIMGMTADEIARTLFSAYGERADEVCRRCIRGENAYIARHGGDLYPGVRDMLETLSARYPLFIVSNCLDEGTTGLRKAGNIALIAKRGGLRAPVYVGDTDMDERSAREAGCPFVFAAYGFGRAESPDAVIAAPMELPALIEGWEGGAQDA